MGILAWWPYILKGRVIKIPKKGWLNFHPAYLPFNRGKHPNFWCLVDETKCGVTLYFIDEVDQDINEGTFHLSKELIETTKIDLDKKYSARKIFNIIRGKMFTPYPTAYVYDNGKNILLK